MSRRGPWKRGARKPASAQSFLRAVPHRNQAIQLERRPDGTTVATVPARKPKYLVPPLSWVVSHPTHRQVQLDAVGSSVLDRCDGVRTIEAIIEDFAADHRLTFRESQLAVGQFLRQLSQRGIVVVVGTSEDVNAGSSPHGRQ